MIDMHNLYGMVDVNASASIACALRWRVAVRPITRHPVSGEGVTFFFYKLVHSYTITHLT